MVYQRNAVYTDKEDEELKKEIDAEEAIISWAVLAQGKETTEEKTNKEISDNFDDKK